MSVDGNLWYVKLADGDVERVTLDQLDEAFQSGQIDESSMVLAAGSDSWVKLADLLGGSDDPAPALAAQPPPAARAPAPLAMQVAPVRPAQVAAPAMHPAALRPPPAAPAVPVASSLRPVSVDLGAHFGLPDRLEEPKFRSSSKKGWVVGGLVSVAALGAGAFFTLKQTSASAASDPMPAFTSAAAAAVPPPTPVAIPATPTPPSPQTTAVGPSSVMDPTMRLNDDQRQKLLDADKKTKSKTKAHVGGGGTGGSGHAPAKDKSSGFTTSGNKFDPLNSSL